MDAAIALYRQLSTLEKSEFVFDEVSLIYAGNELRKANKPGDAIKMYKFNLTVYPNSTETYENLADLYRRTGNVKMAIASYEQLLKIDPKNAPGIWMLRQLKDASAVR